MRFVAHLAVGAVTPTVVAADERVPATLPLGHLNAPVRGSPQRTEGVFRCPN
jgi:hypothetical protein